MFQFKSRFHRQHRYVINQGCRQTSKTWHEWKWSACCSLGPPSSTSVQLRPKGNMIYTRKSDSQRWCFTRCPLSVSGALHASLPASWVTWVNMARQHPGNFKDPFAIHISHFTAGRFHCRSNTFSSFHSKAVFICFCLLAWKRISSNWLSP